MFRRAETIEVYRDIAYIVNAGKTTAALRAGTDIPVSDRTVANSAKAKTLRRVAGQYINRVRCPLKVQLRTKTFCRKVHDKLVALDPNRTTWFAPEATEAAATAVATEATEEATEATDAAPSLVEATAVVAQVAQVEETEAAALEEATEASVEATEAKAVAVAEPVVAELMVEATKAALVAPVASPVVVELVVEAPEVVVAAATPTTATLAISSRKRRRPFLHRRGGFKAPRQRQSPQ